MGFCCCDSCRQFGIEVSGSIYILWYVLRRYAVSSSFSFLYYHQQTDYCHWCGRHGMASRAFPEAGFTSLELMRRLHDDLIIFWDGSIGGGCHRTHFNSVRRESGRIHATLARGLLNLVTLLVGPTSNLLKVHHVSGFDLKRRHDRAIGKDQYFVLPIGCNVPVVFAITQEQGRNALQLIFSGDCVLSRALTNFKFDFESPVVSATAAGLFMTIRTEDGNALYFKYNDLVDAAQLDQPDHRLFSIPIDPKEDQVKRFVDANIDFLPPEDCPSRVSKIVTTKASEKREGAAMIVDRVCAIVLTKKNGLFSFEKDLKSKEEEQLNAYQFNKPSIIQLDTLEANMGAIVAVAMVTRETLPREGEAFGWLKYSLNDTERASGNRAEMARVNRTETASVNRTRTAFVRTNHSVRHTGKLSSKSCNRPNTRSYVGTPNAFSNLVQHIVPEFQNLQSLLAAISLVLWGKLWLVAVLETKGHESRWNDDTTDRTGGEVWAGQCMCEWHLLLE